MHRTILFFSMFAALLFLSLQAGQERACKRPTVCLNMIVKNEKNVIVRCLESVLPLIDYWVICDTGSSDGTQKIIQDFMASKNIPGELHEHEWVNFGHNREEALQLAKFKADYLLFMDADDILSFDDNFHMPLLQHDAYLIRARAGETQYLLTRLIKSSLNWHWHGVLHEYVDTKESKQTALLPGVEYIYIGDGARTHDPKKYEKDVNILHDALEKEPGNARYMFYLAQTHASAGEPRKALDCYHQRVEMGGWDQEVFWAMLQEAYLQYFLKYDRKTVEESFLRALRFRPARPEPYSFLIADARRQGDYQKGYELGKIGIEMPLSKDVLFMEPKAYDSLRFEFALCAWYLGHYQESLDAANHLLAKKTLSLELRSCALELQVQAKTKLDAQQFNQLVDSIFGVTSEPSDLK